MEGRYKGNEATHSNKFSYNIYVSYSFSVSWKGWHILLRFVLILESLIGWVTPECFVDIVLLKLKYKSSSENLIGDFSLRVIRTVNLRPFSIVPNSHGSGGYIKFRTRTRYPCHTTQVSNNNWLKKTTLLSINNTKFNPREIRSKYFCSLIS